MNWKLLMSGLLLSGGLLISGCAILPSPVSLIMAPQQASAQTGDNDPLITVVQKFLPPGAKLEAPQNPDGAKAIQQQDMDDDGKDELLATFRMGQNPGELGAILLQEKQNNWQKVWELNGSLLTALDHASFADITGDGRPELLLGWTMGASLENGLDIFTWQGKETSSGRFTLEYSGPELVPPKLDLDDAKSESPPRVLVSGQVKLDLDDADRVGCAWHGTLAYITSIDYRKMDIINTPNQEDTGKQAALALWHQEAYSTDIPYTFPVGRKAIEVLRWTKAGSDSGWVPAEDLYPEYYKDKVVAFYQKKVKETPEAAFYWYYLADAQVKANLPKDALKSITRGEALKSDYPEDSCWLMVKGEALNKLGKYEEAKSTLINVIQGLEREKDEDKDTLKSIKKGEAVKSDYPEDSMKKNSFDNEFDSEEGVIEINIVFEKDDYLFKAYFDLGQSYVGLKETDKAKAAYEKSLEIVKQYNYESYLLQPLVQRALEKL